MNSKLANYLNIELAKQNKKRHGYPYSLMQYSLKSYVRVGLTCRRAGGCDYHVRLSQNSLRLKLKYEMR